ncbi:MAG: ATP-binding protein [Paracoccaceae bacterium]
MTHSVDPAPRTLSAPPVQRARAWLVLALAAAFTGLGAGWIDPVQRAAFLVVGLALTATVIAAAGLQHWRRQGQTRQWAQLDRLLGDDAAAAFTTDADGALGYLNQSARARFGEAPGATLASAFEGLFANPSAVLYRLQSRAERKGSAREDVVTRRGHVRVSAHRLGGGNCLWRLEEMLELSGPGRGAEALSLPMLIASKSGTVLFANEALRRILGSRPKTLDRIFHRLPLRSGEETRILGAQGAIKALVAEVEGPGERREIYLLPSAEEPAMAEDPEFEGLPVALLRLDLDGRVTGANALARGLLRMGEEANLLVAELLEGLGRPVQDWLDDVAAGRISNRPEILRATRSDEDVFLQVAPRRTVENGRPGLLAVLNDATELKTLEAQFVQGQKMQAIGQLAGGVAHDFNNLLTAISGHCDLLLLRHDRSDPDYADLMQIHQNANRAASLVGQLLAFSRKQTMKPQIIDLRDTLSDLTHLLNRLVGERVSLCLSHDDDLGTIRADKRQLEQVFMNLVVNARDAMSENGGTIWIETEARHLAEPLECGRALVPAGDYAVVRVRDEGTGIAADKLTKIFEPFFTTKRTGEGTGLGLSTVYGIVKQSGGFIFVDSAPGVGTTFTLYFPTRAGESAVATAPAGVARPLPVPLTPARRDGETGGDAGQGAASDAPVNPPREGGVVLLVEDEAPVRAFASRALQLRGYQVIEAASAEEALETLEDPGLTVDVFVTDVIMPGRDGPSWVSEALQTRPDVRVVFVSGYAEESFAEKQARIPNSVYLPKPFSLTDLTTVVQGQMRA